MQLCVSLRKSACSLCAYICANVCAFSVKVFVRMFVVLVHLRVCNCVQLCIFMYVCAFVSV